MRYLSWINPINVFAEGDQSHDNRDLTPLDYIYGLYIYIFITEGMYKIHSQSETIVTSDRVLITHIVEEDMGDTHAHFKRLRECMRRCCEKCIGTNEVNFEHFL